MASNAITWNNMLFMAVELSQKYHWVSNALQTPISRTPRPHHHHSDFHQIMLSVLYSVYWSVMVEPINPIRSNCRCCTRLRLLEAF
ncbi:hypothetical protein IGI04_036333 [Brassica rapa subsp. trilocularis]|uniref:Uncharacterized protein n=1 Tax=Brassica rapa subsp. trilocularis TaxID=1813537 RepID=A0ABQ7LEA4_BRACM|nr:hypothetical protein IGI04_036333 [Brassica rapa subsp. trilocularis]